MIDLHSRRVIGWAVSNRLKRDLALKALNNAGVLGNPPQGCIHPPLMVCKQTIAGQGTVAVNTVPTTITNGCEKWASKYPLSAILRIVCRAGDERQRQQLRQCCRRDILQDPQSLIGLAAHLGNARPSQLRSLSIHQWLLQYPPQILSNRRYLTRQVQTIICMDENRMRNYLGTSSKATLHS
jgi:transposase InsO family protein